MNAADQAVVRQLLRSELHLLQRESLPASQVTKLHEAAELRAVDRFNLTGRTLLTLDDKPPAAGNLLGVDVNGFAAFSAPYVLPTFEIAYVEFSADVAITATTVGTAQVIVDSGSKTYAAVPTLIEFYCPRYLAPAQQCFVVVQDGATVLGTFAVMTSNQDLSAMFAATHITPSAGSHDYKITAWLGGAGTGTFRASTGGAAGDGTTFLPGWIRVSKVLG